jgi:hypothetical protein
MHEHQEQHTGTQGSHMWFIALESSKGARLTSTGTITPVPGETRFDVYTRILRDLTRAYPEMARGNVIHFSLEPNTL